MMAIEVVLPALGLTVEKGKILKWIKKEGETVAKGDSLYEVEADKVTTEVESPASGVLRKILIPEGVEVPILTVVAVITDEKEKLRGSRSHLSLSLLDRVKSRRPQQRANWQRRGVLTFFRFKGRAPVERSSSRT
jgi:pyruvate/2-oxoglutarate dehydrogenase complex dihydrolipoamide acyltransferase (E2) component